MQVERLTIKSQALRAAFRPEFLNRVDETIIFLSLGEEHILKIVGIQLARVRKYLAEKKMDLELTRDAEILLANKGYDPAFGARPLKRAIQHLILDPLSTELLKGHLIEGKTILADAAKDGSSLRFSMK